jgi:phosphoribosyl 1,2-cyclic phosphodiesterase
VLPLFRRDLTLLVIASGSTGNCTYVGDGRNGVLIDCGLSTRRIHKALDARGLASAPIDAVLVTHEHSDHIGSARVLSDRLKRRFGRAVPFYMTQGTHQGARSQSLPERIEYCQPGESFQIGGLQIEPFPVPHDVLDPVAYRVQAGALAVAVITDLGRPTALVARQLRRCDAAVLEFNHDEELLLQGSYPWPLKQRIRSNHGHLSNRQAACLLADGMSSRLRHLVLAHLSDENNRPALAAAAARRVLGDAPVALQVAGRLTGAEPILLTGSAV